MQVTYLIVASLMILATLVPFLPVQHWSVRWFDFVKLQFMVIGVITFAFAFTLDKWSIEVRILQALLLACLIYNATILVKYTRFYKVKGASSHGVSSESLTLLSANVLQFNTDYGRFVDLVRQVGPDMVLTMESNESWDTAMIPLEKEYPYHCKVPLENTYGMHLYSKLSMKAQVHFFVANDIPSIEAELETRDGYPFTLFCIHPPPPSPTEEDNSKERDGELLAVAKKIREDDQTTVVVGDFNNVAWSRSSVLFRKTSETIDPRIGRGFNSTFHAKYWFLRFPIDQLFHSADVFTEELKCLPYFGSDHLALYCKFHINKYDDVQEQIVEELKPSEFHEVNEMIADGIAEKSDRDEIATE